MQKQFRLLSLSLLTFSVAGCAQTVWVRPGTSLAEAQSVSQFCDIQAADSTSPSHLRVAHGHKAGAEIANFAVNLIDEVIQQVAAKRECMITAGFHQETVQPAPVVRYAAAPPATLPQSVVTAPLLPASLPAPGVVEVPATTAPYPAAPIPLTPAAPVVAVQAEPVPPAWSMARRTLVTTRMMELSDRSASKRSFLLGACSAGDETACILTDTRPSARLMRESSLD